MRLWTGFIDVPEDGGHVPTPCWFAAVRSVLDRGGRVVRFAPWPHLLWVQEATDAEWETLRRSVSWVDVLPCENPLIERLCALGAGPSTDGECLVLSRPGVLLPSEETMVARLAGELASLLAHKR
ncbi:MAG: hypothetical protein SNJ76_13175 [Fimbriimonadaceae bacterium]